MSFHKLAPLVSLTMSHWDNERDKGETERMNLRWKTGKMWKDGA